MNWTVCIDFGTAFSKAAAAPAGAWTDFDAAKIRPLMLNALGGGNPFLLDSAVFIAGDEILFGAAAISAAAEAGGKRQALRSFKTILSAPDLERALSARAPASIDPERALQQRDLVVLYLAFLMGAVERAVASDPVVGAVNAWRYASPAWRDDRIAAHRVIERLFGEARVVGNALKIAENRVAAASARAALAGARDDVAAATWRMDMVYEATAAAACSAVSLADRATHVIVVDVGAGTTDIAALAGSAELHEARVTLAQAGDFMDRVLLNQALAASPNLKSVAQQQELWAAMGPNVRDLKESLFATGRGVFRFGARVINLSLKDFERDKGFKQFQNDLTRAYLGALKALRDRARADKQKHIVAVAVGGGAPAPFIQALIKSSAPGGGVKVVARPSIPDWANAAAFGGNLAPVFPQLAVAIGGALAPEAMLAAYDRASA
ncbi:hypothetical protein U91I_00019 [alpha proteobacterium U9-1i]|nr:hypothetical protein U91I_00019 [alpha proteobacterium U9-1i]